MKSLMSLNHKKAGRTQQAALVLLVFTLPLFLGAWKITTGRDINPTYVERIQDGKTKKHEILTLFGDPDEVDRTPEAVVYLYEAYRNKETLPKRQRELKSTPQDSPYFQEDWLKEKKKREAAAAANKELDRRLIIRFDREGQIVQSHEYKQF